MPRAKGEEKTDTHIYISAALMKRFKAARMALEPAAPSQNALVTSLIKKWTEEQEASQ